MWGKHWMEWKDLVNFLIWLKAEFNFGMCISLCKDSAPIWKNKSEISLLNIQFEFWISYRYYWHFWIKWNIESEKWAPTNFELFLTGFIGIVFLCLNFYKMDFFLLYERFYEYFFIKFFSSQKDCRKLNFCQNLH